MRMENYICQKIKVIEQLFDKISQTPSQKAFETALLQDSCCQIKGGSGFWFKLQAGHSF